LLQSVPIPKQPFDCIGMDFLGPFPRSDSGMRYIIVCVDYLTRFAETKAVRHATSSAVADFYLRRIVLRHGSPRIIISDRGKAFVSRFLSDVFRIYQSVHRRTTAYHPQCNGLTERFNHTLADMLSMYVNTAHSNWDTILPFVTYAYNTSVQASSGFTPFRLVYGREALTPLDALLSSSSSFQSSDPRSQSYVDAARDARDLAREALITSQELQRRYYNSRHYD